jgi:rod shape-determining protein MreD
MNLLGSESFDLDFLTILIAYLFLFYRSVPVGWFAFGQGLLIDIFSGGFHGLFTLLYLGVFGGIHLGSRFFNPQGPKGQVIIISLSVLLKKALLLMVLNAFSRDPVFFKTFLWTSGASAICTGMFGPILFFLFNRLRGVSFEDALSPSTEKLQAFKDESFFQ